MQMIYKKRPSNAQLMLERLKEQSMFDLYSEESYKDPIYGNDHKSLIKLRESYNPMIDNRKIIKENLANFKDRLMEECMLQSIFFNILQPVLEEGYAKTKDYQFGYNLIKNYIQEHGVYNLIQDYKQKNIYLDDIVNTAEITENIVMNEIYDRINEGLTEKDIYNVEEESISKIIKDNSCKIPKDISKRIYNRVEKGLKDFIDYNKLAQAKLTGVYHKAKDQIDKYNLATNMAAIDGQFSAMQNPIDIDGKPLDLTSQGDMNDPSFSNNNVQANDPNSMPINGSPGAMTPQQEMVADLHRAESKILEEEYNIFGAIARALTKNMHINESLNKYYNNNISLIIDDAKTIYTFLECINTLEMETIDKFYLKNMIQEIMNLDADNTTVDGTTNAANQIATSSSTSSSVPPTSKPSIQQPPQKDLLGIAGMGGKCKNGMNC